MNTKLLFVGLVIGVVLISGCTQEPEQTTPFCNKPYIQVGTDCCLDADENNICVNDEETTTPEETTTIRQPSVETTSPRMAVSSAFIRMRAKAIRYISTTSLTVLQV